MSHETIPDPPDKQYKTTISQRLSTGNGGSVVIACLGILFFGSYLAYISVHAAYLQGPIWLFPLGVVLVLVLSVGLIYGGYWVATSGFSAEQSWRVTIWTFAGLIGAVAFTFWPIFYQRIVGVSIADPIFILLVSAGLGGNAGIVAGVAQARSDRQFKRIQRARDSFGFLNRLLRHNVLNAINIIDGNTKLLLEDLQRETAVNRARTIRQQSEKITDLIQTVRVLAHQNTEEMKSEPVNLTAIVADELEVARETYDDAVIESDLAPDTYVRADGLVSAVVENLVTNAITHNDQKPPRTDVSLETRNGTAILRVADNGPGIPAEDKDRIGEPGPYGDSGLGLYLVNTLVTNYNGNVDFAENEPRGTVVTVEFPVAGDR